MVGTNYRAYETKIRYLSSNKLRKLRARTEGRRASAGTPKVLRGVRFT